MTRITTIVEALVAAGATPEMILAAVRVAEGQNVEAEEARKAKGRERWRRWNENQKSNVSKRQQTLTNNSREGVTRVEEKTSNLDIEPQKKEQKDALTREFDLFWAEWPNRVGKPKALASFVAARKRASFDDIMAGLRRYVASKPADRAWLNPATFFNQDRWDDMPANVVPMARGSPRPVDNLIDSLLTRMDHADANPTAEIEGYSPVARGLPGY